MCDKIGARVFFGLSARFSSMLLCVPVRDCAHVNIYIYEYVSIKLVSVYAKRCEGRAQSSRVEFSTTIGKPR